MMNNNSYSRDYRSPIPSSLLVSKVMSSIKGKNTKPELVIREMLYSSGFRGYRIHYEKIAGSPDIAFTKNKLAIFINGCFWHRCPKCNLPMPKSNVEFWKNKFAKNILRDQTKITDLQKNGWRVITIWECEIKKNPFDVLDLINSYF